MRLPGITVSHLMILVAAIGFGLGILAYGVRWMQYPHIDVRIVNETSSPIFDLQLGFMCGERTAKQLRPGGVGIAEIQSGGDAGIFFSYRDSEGILRKADPLYHESGVRGFLEIHVTKQGTRFVNGIEPLDFSMPILGIRQVPPTGQILDQ